MRIAQLCCEMVQPLLNHLATPLRLKQPDLKAYLAGWDAFIIQASFRYETDHFIEWGGMKFIASLRKDYQIEAPIILTSWVRDLVSPQGGYHEAIAELQDRKVLMDPLVKFIPLYDLVLFSPKDLAQSLDEPLTTTSGDNLTFQEMVNILYEDEYAFIKESIHRLLARLYQEKLTLEEAASLVYQELLQIRLLLKDRHQEIMAIADEFRPDNLRIRSKEAFFRLLGEKIESLRAYLNPTPVPLKPQAPERKQHILFIDDNKADREELAKILLPYQIISHGVGTIEECHQLLATQPITAVLCDYRIYDVYGRLNRYQGAQVMKRLKKEHPSLYFAYLSSFPLGKDDLILQTGVHFYNKQEVFSTQAPGFPLLVNRILQSRELNENILNHLPEKLRGRKIIPFYIDYRYAPAWQDWEREISEKAFEIAESFRSGQDIHRGFGKGVQKKFPKVDQQEQASSQVYKVMLCRRVLILTLQLPIKYFIDRSFTHLKAAEMRREKFEAIYDFIFGNSIDSDTLYTSKQTSLSDTLYIFSSKSYDFVKEPEETRALLFPEEWSWLINHQPLINKFRS